MRRFFLLIAMLIMPGGLIVLFFRMLRHLKQHILDFFSRLKQKFLP